MNQQSTDSHKDSQSPPVLTESSAKIDVPVSAVESTGFLGWIKNMVRSEAEPTLRETLDEYINDIGDAAHHSQAARQESILLSNILRLREMAVTQVMIPRADIVAIELGTTQEELLELLAEKQFSRLPVYRGTLDDVLGTIHIKDILATMARGEKIDIRSLVNEIPIVSPAMSVSDLLVVMRESSRHMALVVDEFGGIDGLVTINDVFESIVGEIDDEHENDYEMHFVKNEDGSVGIDARMPLEDLEQHFHVTFSESERAGVDTISGLVYGIGGRIPGRGEVLKHSSGIIFEVTDADRRRIKHLKVMRTPKAQT